MTVGTLLPELETPADAGRGRLYRRRWPLIVGILYMAVSLLYSFSWHTVAGHIHYWHQPGDIWGSLDSAHFIAWGDIGDVYTAQNGYIVPPGLALVLTPVAFVVSHLHLSESYPWANPHPSAWPLLDVVQLALGTFVLFATDAVAEVLEVRGWRRPVLMVAEAVGLWQVVTIWGHPEDAVALGFALYALVDGAAGRWRRSGWLWGLAVVFQPLALLLLPLSVGRAPDTRQRLLLLVRGAIPTAVLLVIPLIQSWRATTDALVKQPTFPSLLHPTPMLWSAPILIRNGVHATHEVQLVPTAHGPRFIKVTLAGHPGNVVAPGPARLLALLVAIAIGVWVWRHRPNLQRTVWLAGLALCAWVALEPVMASYYVWPALAVLMVAASTVRWWRGLVSLVAVAVAGHWATTNHGPWAYWTPIVLSLAVALAASYRSSTERPARDGGEAGPAEAVRVGRAEAGPSRS